MPTNKVKEFETVFLAALEKRYPDVLKTLRDKGAKLNADLENKLKEVASEVSLQYRK